MSPLRRTSAFCSEFPRRCLGESLQRVVPGQSMDDPEVGSASGAGAPQNAFDLNVSSRRLKQWLRRVQAGMATDCQLPRPPSKTFSLNRETCPADVVD
jgi:hypothetical protein